MQKFIARLLVILVVCLVVLNLVYDDGLEPDVVYPMANRNIEWTYAGK